MIVLQILRLHRSLAAAASCHSFASGASAASSAASACFHIFIQTSDRQPEHPGHNQRSNHSSHFQTPFCRFTGIPLYIYLSHLFTDKILETHHGTNLVNQEGHNPCETALIADSSQGPFQRVHFSADCTDCRKAWSAQQVEYHKCISTCHCEVLRNNSRR